MKHYVCAYITECNNAWTTHSRILEAENARDARQRFDAGYTGDGRPSHIVVKSMARLRFCPLCSSELIRKGRALECSKRQCGLRINLPNISTASQLREE